MKSPSVLGYFCEIQASCLPGERAWWRREIRGEAPLTRPGRPAHPAVCILDDRRVFVDFVLVVVFDRVLQEFKAVPKNLGLHPSVRAVCPFSYERSHLKLARPVVPDRDEVPGMLLVAAAGGGQNLGLENRISSNVSRGEG